MGVEKTPHDEIREKLPRMGSFEAFALDETWFLVSECERDVSSATYLKGTELETGPYLIWSMVDGNGVPWLMGKYNATSVIRVCIN